MRVDAGKEETPAPNSDELRQQASTLPGLGSGQEKEDPSGYPQRQGRPKEPTTPLSWGLGSLGAALRGGPKIHPAYKGELRLRPVLLALRQTLPWALLPLVFLKRFGGNSYHFVSPHMLSHNYCTLRGTSISDYFFPNQINSASQEAGGLRPNAIAPAYTKLACGIPVVGLPKSCGCQP